MNILVISLLRAGDFILQAPLVKSISRRGKVHVLVNDEFKQLQDLYPEFHFHFFPRKEIQTVINDSSTSLFEPYRILEKFFLEMGKVTWDSIYNLTHTRVSAYVMGELTASRKHGLLHEKGQFRPFENSWMGFLNDEFSQNKRSPFHYVTVLAQAMNLAIPIPFVSQKRDTKRILLQCFTSDEKKNWPLHNWEQLFHRLKQARRGYQVQVICSPSEHEHLKVLFDEKDLIVCSLSEARKEIENSDLFISGDTSLAHLAAEVRTPVVTLSLGSSDLTKTAPWQQGAIVLTTIVPCGPCHHSHRCPFTSPACGEQLKVRSVLSAALAQLEDRSQISIADPERIFRFEYKNKQGLVPTEISLSRRKDGIIDQDIELL